MIIVNLRAQVTNNFWKNLYFVHFFLRALAYYALAREKFYKKTNNYAVQTGAELAQKKWQPTGHHFHYLLTALFSLLSTLYFLYSSTPFFKNSTKPSTDRS